MYNSDKASKINRDNFRYWDKWRYTIYTTFLFFVVINQYTYKLVNSIFKGIVKISYNDGCPTVNGTIIHGIIFTCILRFMMDLNL